jgi:hypothetical protein
MPAYSRERLASCAIAANRSASLGNAAVSTPVMEPDTQEGADGKEMRMLTITYTRRVKAAENAGAKK